MKSRKPAEHQLAQRRAIQAEICGDIVYVIHVMKTLEEKPRNGYQDNIRRPSV